MPYRLFPYITLAWLIVGAAIVLFAPDMAKRMGDGLTRMLGLSSANSDSAVTGDLAGDPPKAG